MAPRYPLQFATLKALREPPAPPPHMFASISSSDKVQAIRRASSDLAIYLRARHTMPLSVTPEDVTVSSVAGLAEVVGQPARVADVVIRIGTGGTVGSDALTYQVSTDDGQTFGPVVMLPASGVVEVDTCTTTLQGAWLSGEAIAYRARVDAAIEGAAIKLASYYLLTSRGKSPANKIDLKAGADEAFKTVQAIGAGEGHLEQDADATPGVSELGPLGTGAKSPYDWLRKQGGGGCCGGYP